MKLRDSDREKMREIWESGRFDVYVGNIKYFVSRVTDGFVIGFTDRKYRAEPDDHWTIIFDPESFQIESVHRTVRTKEIDRITNVDWSYLIEPDGYRTLFNDLTEQNSSYIFRIILPMVYSLGNYFHQATERMKVEIYSEDEAKQNNVGTNGILKILLPWYDRLILRILMIEIRMLTKKEIHLKTGEKNVPGLIISWRERL